MKNNVPKYVNGGTVYTRATGEKLKINEPPKWNGLTYMYAFEGTEMRCGESYITAIPPVAAKSDTILKSDEDFILGALQFFWQDAHQNLQKKDLGDIERKNYEFQYTRSKEIMKRIDPL
jgi:hypothetical protein